MARVTLEIVDGHQLVTVRRLGRPGTINPALEIDGVPIVFAEDDTILFLDFCNFAQAARETPILTESPYTRTDLNLILRGVNGKNCTAPTHAVIEGGLWAHYTSRPTHVVEITHAGGVATATRYRDVPDGDPVPAPVEYDIDRTSPSYPGTPSQLLSQLETLTTVSEYISRADLKTWYQNDEVLRWYVDILRVGIELERRVGE